MRALPTMLLLLGTVAAAQTPGGTDASTPTPPRSPPLTRAQIEAIRDELHAGKSDLIAKNVSFTSQEAAKFWPVYKQYETAGRALNDKRWDLLVKYVDAWR